MPRVARFATTHRGLTDEREHVRIEAAYMLGELGSVAKPAVPALQKAQEDTSENVRTAAATSLEVLAKSQSVSGTLESRSPVGGCQARHTDRRNCLRPASERRHTRGSGVPALAVTFVGDAGFVRASLAPPTGSCSCNSISGPRAGH